MGSAQGSREVESETKEMRQGVGTHDGEKMLRAHTGTKPETPTGGVHVCEN